MLAVEGFYVGGGGVRPVCDCGCGAAGAAWFVGQFPREDGWVEWVAGDDGVDVGAVGGLGGGGGVPGLGGGGEVGIVSWDAAVVGPVVD